MEITFKPIPLEKVAPPDDPSYDTLFEHANMLLDGALDSSNRTWSNPTIIQRKQQANTIPIQTRTAPNHTSTNSFWAVRSSEHSGTYAQFKRALLIDHYQNEKQYIHMINSSTPIKVYKKDAMEAWAIDYSMPFPLRPRTFQVLLLSREYNVNDPDKQPYFINIQLPIDATASSSPLPSKHIFAKYVSVERVEQFAAENGNHVRWIMATSSSIDGFIPKFLTNRSLASEITNDVPALLKWIEERDEQ